MCQRRQAEKWCTIANRKTFRPPLPQSLGCYLEAVVRLGHMRIGLPCRVQLMPPCASPPEASIPTTQASPLDPSYSCCRPSLSLLLALSSEEGACHSGAEITRPKPTPIKRVSLQVNARVWVAGGEGVAGKSGWTYDGRKTSVSRLGGRREGVQAQQLLVLE